MNYADSASGRTFYVRAGSRKRWIQPAGFYWLFRVMPFVPFLLQLLILSVRRHPWSGPAKAWKKARESCCIKLLMKNCHSVLEPQ